MRKILFGVLIAIACSAGAALTGLMVHDHSSNAKGGGTLNLSGTLSSTKACDSGYVRRGPNLCLRETNIGGATVSTSCTSVTLPTGAKALIYHYGLVATANNAIASRSAQITFAAENTCAATLVEIAFLLTREYVATAAGTIVAQTIGEITVDVPTTGLWTQAVNSGGVNTGGSLELRGYYD